MRKPLTQQNRQNRYYSSYGCSSNPNGLPKREEVGRTSSFKRTKRGKVTHPDHGEPAQNVRPSASKRNERSGGKPVEHYERVRPGGAPKKGRKPGAAGDYKLELR